MEVDTETSTSVQELVSSLEQATLMASRIPTTADPYQLHQIRSTLLSAHRRLSLFQHHQPPPPENSGASAVGVAGDDNDVKMGDEEEEQNSRAVTTSTAAVDKVEERMRDCFIQNKRSKRALSPSMVVAAEQRRSWENDGFRDGAVAAEFDPYSAKCRSLDLIYQFYA